MLSWKAVPEHHNSQQSDLLSPLSLSLSLTSCRLLRVPTEETLRCSLPGLRQVGVGPAVELSLGAASLATRAVAEGLQGLVGVDEVLAPGLGGELTPRLSCNTTPGSHCTRHLQRDSRDSHWFSR